jgi:hypothetical protein
MNSFVAHFLIHHEKVGELDRDTRIWNLGFFQVLARVTAGSPWHSSMFRGTNIETTQTPELEHFK